MTYAEAEEAVKAANAGLGRVSEEAAAAAAAGGGTGTSFGPVYGKKVKKERPTGEFSLFG
jgi:hypothetical protein